MMPLEFYRGHFREQGLEAADAERMAKLAAEWRADEVAFGFDRAREDEGWFAVRNYTAKAIKLETVLEEEK
jgi:hypothetical protein